MSLPWLLYIVGGPGKRLSQCVCNEPACPGPWTPRAEATGGKMKMANVCSSQQLRTTIQLHMMVMEAKK